MLKSFLKVFSNERGLQDLGPFKTKLSDTKTYILTYPPPIKSATPSVLPKAVPFVLVYPLA